MVKDERDGIPKIFRHRAIFSPLKEIDYKAEYNLGRSIQEKIESGDIKIDVSLAEKLLLKSMDLQSALYDLALIVLRLNDDILKSNRKEELFEIVRLHNRMWTYEEEKEYERLEIFDSYLNLDIRILIVNLVIFMDILAKFLSLCISGESKPQSDSFFHFRKDLIKYKGEDAFELLKRIIIENTEWFNQIKELRDDFVIHHAAARHVLEFLNGEPYIPFTTTKHEYSNRHIVMGAKAKSVSMKWIEDTFSQFKELLTKLNVCLSNNINTLPFECNM